MNNLVLKSVGAAVASLALATAVLAQEGKATATLKLDPSYLNFEGTRRQGKMYMPSSVELSTNKPSIVKKSPPFKGEPVYGVVTLGNGPRAAHAVAIDVPAEGDATIYIDVEGTGDLTTPGGVAWPVKKVVDGITNYEGTFMFRASYGTASKETSHETYGLNFYWSVGRASLNYYRASARMGQIKVDGENYKVTVIEENNDGLFNKPFAINHKPTKPVWLVLDGTSFDARGTFSLNGMNYQAILSPDGSKLTLQTTARAITPPKQEAIKEPDLLKIGSVAPDFEVPSYGGGTVHLADLHGKIVVLDFWATWCGPCKASMPHVQKVYEKVKDQNVYVLGLNVFDDKAAYDQWIPANSQYQFHFAFDPAGRDASSIAKSKYNVSGIPTTYVIDGDGKIAAAILGYAGLDDHRLEQALAKLKVNIEAPAERKSVPMTGLGGGK